MMEHWMLLVQITFPECKVSKTIYVAHKRKKGEHE